MMCRQAKEWMAEGWNGELDSAREPELRMHLESCAECRAEMSSLSLMWDRLADMPVPEPSHALDERFESTFAALTAAGTPSKPAPRLAFSFWPKQPLWQGAIAFATLVLGVSAGIAIGARSQRDSNEIARLREEVASTRQLVALSLLRQDSAADRLRGVDYSVRSQAVDPAIAIALVNAVEHDPSVNVRLAAIDALTQAARSAGVMSSLAQSLPHQESPMVQAALVDYIVDSNDRQAIGSLRDLAAQPELNPAVLERARFAIGKLSK